MRILKKSFAVISIAERNLLFRLLKDLSPVKSGIRDDNFQGFFSVLIYQRLDMKTPLINERATKHLQSCNELLFCGVLWSKNQI